MEKLFVTGATGHLGKSVVEQLLEITAPENIVILARNSAKANYFRSKGIDIRIGDYKNVVSLQKAFKGIDRVMLISASDPFTRLQQHMNVVDAAQISGVKHIVYTGVAIKNPDSSANQFLIQSHFRTESYIIKSELNYTFLRNNLYTDVIPMFVGEHVFDSGITLPTQEGKVAFALRREIGEAAGNVLVQSTHQDKTYEITGAAAYSFEDVARELSLLSGKKISYNQLDSAAYSAHLRQLGVPDHFVQMLAAFTADIKNNRHAGISRDLEVLLGRKPAGLTEALKELYDL